MIETAVLCPHPPLLFRELAGGHDPVADLRFACARAVADLLSGGHDRIALVGGADVAGPLDPGLPIDVRGFGSAAPRTPPDRLPLSLGVGRRLLDEAGWSGPTAMVAIPWDAGDGDLVPLASRLAAGAGTGVLLLGDGSARRGPSAPGFWDERSLAFDDLVGDALAVGDAAALRDLDVDLARDLMVGGRAAFRMLGHLAGDRPVRADLVHRDDPYGVSYYVAAWEF